MASTEQNLEDLVKVIQCLTELVLQLQDRIERLEDKSGGV